MQFLYPGFLWALTALAVPVIIHLFHFRRYKKVYFTNVRFLREVVEENRTRQRLRHWMVLALRMLAIAALVLAFAQPVLPGDDGARNAPRRSVSVYVDNSFSMDALGEDRSLLEQARERARAIAEAHGPDDRFQLLNADLAGRNQRLLDREEFLEAVETVRLSPKAPTMEAVYRRQRDALESGDGDHSAYLISDFQQSLGAIEPDSMLTTYLVPLAGQEQRNLSLDSAWFDNPLPLPGQPASLRVRVNNHGTVDAEDVSLKLYLDPANAAREASGRDIRALAELNIPAGGVVEDTLVFTVPPAGWQIGEVSLTDYPVTFDDRWHVALNVPQDFPVLVVGSGEGNPFLNNVFGSNPRFRLENRSAGGVDYAGLAAFGLIVLDGLDAIPTGLAAELQTFMDAGGSVLVFPGEKATADGYAPLFDEAGIRLGARVNTPRTVVSLNTEHPLYADVFETVPRNLTLPTAQLSYRLQAGPRSRQDVLMRFRDGDPFLAVHALGAGRLLVGTSPLNRAASDLPVQGGILVPLLVKLGAAGAADKPLSYVIGGADWIDLGTAAWDNDAPPVVRMGQAQEFIPAIQRNGQRLRIRVDEGASEAGQYAAYGSDGALLGHFALNYDRRESDLSAPSAEALEAAYEGTNVRILEGSPERLAAAVGRLADGRRLWKAFLIFALVCLALETALLRWAQR